MIILFGSLGGVFHRITTGVQVAWKPNPNPNLNPTATPTPDPTYWVASDTGIANPYPDFTSASNPGAEVMVRYCILQAALGADVTNLHSTHYNIVDADVQAIVLPTI